LSVAVVAFLTRFEDSVAASGAFGWLGLRPALTITLTNGLHTISVFVAHGRTINSAGITLLSFIKLSIATGSRAWN